MNIHQAQRLAKNNDEHLEFLADFPAGTFRCHWIDAYFGLLTIPGIENLKDGFLTVDQIDEMFPDLHCHPVVELAP